MANRRDLLFSLASVLSAPFLASPARSFGSAETKKIGLGIVLYCCSNRQKAQRAQGGSDLGDPLVFLEHCHRMGASGIQTPLGIRDEKYTSELRQTAESYGMFIEGIAELPGTEKEADRFDAQVRTAKQSGARTIRLVIIPGRRYERFDSIDEFRKFAERGERSLELAEPIAARHRMTLAVENHKDQRISERLELLKRISSPYVGACVDTGNSFALLEDPIEVVQAYAPWAHSVHLKDQAVREYPEGFLFADCALGEGFLDLATMVEILRKAKPDIRFSLEMITRDPLAVPCLTDKYWATFPDVQGRDLARTIRTVRARASAEPLQRVSHLSPDEKVVLENSNVKKSLEYAREQLGLWS
jgi:sugar phosphate isomerase/epimerase